MAALASIAWTCLAAMDKAPDAITVPLKYEKIDKTPGPRGSASLLLNSKMPAGHWKLPEFKSGQPLYALVQLGDKEQLLVLARTQAKSKNTLISGLEDLFGGETQQQEDGTISGSSLFFDANGNGDLTDDPVIEPQSDIENYSRNTVVFPAIDTTVEVNGASLPYRFQVSVYAVSRDMIPPRRVETRMSLNVNCYYSGEFQINGRTYKLWLADSNGNGKFGDKLERKFCPSCHRFHTGGDQLYLTVKDKLSEQDAQYFCEYLWLDGGVFQMAFSGARPELVLTREVSDLNPLGLAATPDRITLFSENGSRSLAMFQPSRDVQVPAGKYELIDYLMIRPDSEGDVWKLQAVISTNMSSAEVGPGKTAQLKMGEPYRPVVTVIRSADPRRSKFERIRLDFTLVGAGNETVSDITRVSGNKTKLGLSSKRRGRPAEPTYMVTKSDGEIVGKGAFEYG